jgi:hypothetical protein
MAAHRKLDRYRVCRYGVGRGRGVGRGLGVTRGVVVGVTVAVGVAVGVGVGVGVGVTAPQSDLSTVFVSAVPSYPPTTIAVVPIAVPAV